MGNWILQVCDLLAKLCKIFLWGIDAKQKASFLSDLQIIWEKTTGRNCEGSNPQNRTHFSIPDIEKGKRVFEKENLPEPSHTEEQIAKVALGKKYLCNQNLCAG